MDQQLPSRAIAAFEEASGLIFCCHDHRNTLKPYLAPQRYEHTNPLCRLVKDGRHAACIAFDVRLMTARAGEFPDGVIKRCHAGIVELYLPVFIDQRLEWVLYAGLRRAAAALPIGVDDPARKSLGARGPWAAAVARLPTLDARGADHLLELLRQLAARLVAWRQGLRRAVPMLAGGPTPPAAVARRTAILAFISKRHVEAGLRLDDLAHHLGLSVDRAGHAVTEACGEGFSRLLARARLDSARGLLRLSDLPMREVARQSGFGNRAHFFAVFRGAFATTPAAYRRGEGGPA